MKVKGSIVALVLLLSLGSFAQTVKGYVFEDSNGNGKKERREKGIAEVAVTNGRDVVLTDKDGEYRLPLSGNAIISVIKPSGYRFRTNSQNQPQFFYNHKPEGSPSSEFKGVEPTGKLPRSVNFALIASKEPDSFTTLLFGDPQPYTQQEVDFFAEGIVSEVAGIEEVAFGLSLGDLVGDDLGLFNPYIEAVQAVGIPWYNLMGNHDLNFDAAEDSLSDETYEAHFGPGTYAFNYGKVHFIILDDILYPDPRDSRGYWGGFREDQLDFVENDLKYVPKDHLIVLAMHIPLSEPDFDSFRDEDRARLFRLLSDFPNTLSLSAHTHLQRQELLGEASGWLQEQPHHHYNAGTTSGDWYSGKLDENGVPVSTMRDGTPKGYAFINFQGNEYSIDYKVAGEPEDYQIKIFAPKVVAKDRNSSAGIYANFFMGSETDQVSYRIDGGEWKPMRRVEEFDPTYVLQLFEWDTTEELIPGRRASNPEKSTHLWKGNIPTHLAAGEHKIEVRATDMFGRSFSEESTYRVEQPQPLFPPQ